jgi:transcriptional regulator with XRE-family HTH domain
VAVAIDPDGLRSELRRRGLTQAACAAGAGFSAPALSRALNGHTSVRPATLKRLVGFLATVEPLDDQLVAAISRKKTASTDTTLVPAASEEAVRCAAGAHDPAA